MTCLVELLLDEQSDFRGHTFAAPGYRAGKCLPGSTVTDAVLQRTSLGKKRTLSRIDFSCRIIENSS